MTTTRKVTAAATLAAAIIGCTTAASPTGSHDATPMRKITTTTKVAQAPGFNCLTMGTRRCGPEYLQIEDTSDWRRWYRIIYSDHQGYDPYRCLVRPTPTSIVCQDGWVEHS